MARRPRISRRSVVAALAAGVAVAPLGRMLPADRWWTRRDAGAAPRGSVGGAMVPGDRISGHLAGLARDSFSTNSGANVFDPASSLGLRVITREEWGADETLRFREDGTESWPEMFVPPRLIVVHHTATPNSYGDLQEAMAELRSIYNFHARGRAWGDIGYHAVIDRFGHIFEGRHGRGGDPGDDRREREILSHGVTGGHVTEYEYGTVGVALLGDATSDDWDMHDPSGPMWEALVRYCAFEAARSGIVPLAPGPGGLEPARTEFLRSDDAWHDGVQVVCGHDEVQETLCPGGPVVGLLPELRTAVTAELSLLRSPPISLATSVSQRTIPVDTEVVCVPTAAPANGGLELEYLVEGWFKPLDSEDIDYLSGYTPDRQPRFAWLPVAERQEIRFMPAHPGHYAIHLRAILGSSGDTRRSVDRAVATYLVPRPAAVEKG